ncbi:MAG: hypothetical protein KAU28_04075 [Phycisphaerae bacterium]|nr:hypothetical protein [Phycisphaerae bacterium]
MPAPHATTPQWQQRLKEELTRNKKQTLVLGALVLVGLVLGARMLNKKPAPGKAAASVAELTPDGASSLSSVMPSEAASTANTDRDEYIRRISHDITRDLFEFHADLYPLVRPPQPSLPAAAPGQPPGQATEELVRMRAAELLLQSTIDSEIPVAVINGRVLAANDKIDGFRVVEISSGWCVVEQAGVQVRLDMRPD